MGSRMQASTDATNAYNDAIREATRATFDFESVSDLAGDQKLLGKESGVFLFDDPAEMVRDASEWMRHGAISIRRWQKLSRELEVFSPDFLRT